MTYTPLSPQKIAAKAIKQMNRKITNEIFMIIQNDPKLMRDYLEDVHKSGVQTVNQQIGKAVKAAYGLKNLNDREENPQCTLIQSHQIFE